MREYVIKSEKYSTERIEKPNLDSVRKYVVNFYPSTAKEVNVLSKQGKQYGNVLFNNKGAAFWYTSKRLYVLHNNGKLGQEIPIPKRK